MVSNAKQHRSIRRGHPVICAGDCDGVVIGAVGIWAVLVLLGFATIVFAIAEWVSNVLPV